MEFIDQRKGRVRANAGKKNNWIFRREVASPLLNLLFSKPNLVLTVLIRLVHSLSFSLKATVLVSMEFLFEKYKAGAPFREPRADPK